jgi:hypothetical protein
MSSQVVARIPLGRPTLKALVFLEGYTVWSCGICDRGIGQDWSGQ